MAGGLISDRYELGDRLGSGGMSTVYMATDGVLERTVAVKILAEHLSDDDKFVARFRREALAVARLIHPNIVQVYDTGVDQGRHYIVMEYVEGRSVAQLLQRRGRLGSEVAVAVGVQACAGLEYAHRQGIIHRDVKPGNLMVIGGPAGRPSRGGSAHEPPTDEMTVKLTDFGIARAAEQTRLTQVGSVVGTAAYLSPEQSRGEETTPAADVYALGVVVYQMLTARLPWEGSTLAELAIRRESESPLPPTSYDDTVPETLSTAVLRALEGDVNSRYATAKELSAALRAGIAGREPPEAADTMPTRAMAAGAAATAATRRDGRLAGHRHPGRSRADLRAPAARPAARRPARRAAQEAIGRKPLHAGPRRPAPDRAHRRGDRRRRPTGDRRRPGHGHRAADLGRDRSADRQPEGRHPRQPPVGRAQASHGAAPASEASR